MYKLSRNGIAYDLKHSPYKSIYNYNGVLLEYVFSSKTYMEKFDLRVDENRSKISESLSNRFGVKYENHLLSDLALYLKIEKRGFLLFKDEVAVECPEDITLDGTIMTIKS